MAVPTMKFGCEIEMFAHYDDDVDVGDQVEMALNLFGTHGLCQHESLCDYHCSCDWCVYDRPHALLAAQEDSTVGAEFITRILSTRSNKDLTELRRLQRAYAEVQDATGFYPDGDISCGNHVHVGWPEGLRPVEIGQARSLLNGLFSAEIDLWTEEIATGGAPHVRGYNASPMERYDQWTGSWLGANSGTIEFRVWNTPRDSGRLLVHPALSVAMTTWALEVVDEEGDTRNFDSARTTAAWARDRAAASRKRIAKIVRDIWPDAASASLAAELVGI